MKDLNRSAFTLCHCERSEAVSWDCHVASLLAMTPFRCRSFVVFNLLKVPPTFWQTGCKPSPAPSPGPLSRIDCNIGVFSSPLDKGNDVFWENEDGTTP